jgi:hypothetical protein
MKYHVGDMLCIITPLDFLKRALASLILRCRSEISNITLVSDASHKNSYKETSAPFSITRIHYFM